MRNNEAGILLWKYCRILKVKLHNCDGWLKSQDESNRNDAVLIGFRLDPSNAVLTVLMQFGLRIVKDLISFISLFVLMVLSSMQLVKTLMTVSVHFLIIDKLDFLHDAIRTWK